MVVGGSLRWPIMQFGNSGVDQEYHGPFALLEMKSEEVWPGTLTRS